MGILNHYIFKEFIPHFLTGTLFFTLLFAIPELKGLVGLVVEKGVPMVVVLELFLYLIPVTASITIPMGTLFGVLFCLGRLSQDSEIVAMRANGISLFRIFKPVFLIGIVSGLFLFYFMNYIITETNLRYKTLSANVAYANPSIIMSPKEFTGFSKDNQKITALEIDREGKMYSVYLYERNEEKKEIKVIYAKIGEWVNNSFNATELALKLFDGELIRFDAENEDVLERINFNEFVFNFIQDNRKVDLAQRGIQEMSIFEVWEMIDKQISDQVKVEPSTYVELQRKFSLPLACISFVIMAIPLAVSFQRSGKGIGLGVSLVVILVYYILLSTAEALGKTETVNPNLAMHIPNITFVIIGFTLFIIKTKK